VGERWGGVGRSCVRHRRGVADWRRHQKIFLKYLYIFRQRPCDEPLTRISGKCRAGSPAFFSPPSPAADGPSAGPRSPSWPTKLLPVLDLDFEDYVWLISIRHTDFS
jgi:hypothetical protein